MGDRVRDDKAAAAAFVDELTGTNSRISLQTFATNAPADGLTNLSLPLTSVLTSESAATVNTRINGLAGTPNYEGGGSNWDRGFHQIVETGETYDAVLFLTDGSPTFHRDAQGLGGSPTIRELNEAIHSANAVKALPNEPAIVVVASNLGGATETQLSLISGPTNGTDYHLTSFDNLATTMAGVAEALCSNPPQYADLQVSTTAGASFDRAYDWTIEKSAEVDRVQVADATAGATVGYGLTVTPSEPVESGFEVGGAITVTNPNDVSISGVDVGAALDLPNVTCTVTNGTGLEIPALGVAELAYTCPVTDGTASTSGTATGTATWNAAAYRGSTGTATGGGAFDFATADVDSTNGSVTVTDTATDLSTYDDGARVGNVVEGDDGAASFAYDVTWPATDGECVVHPNTATLAETGQESGATVEVCAGALAIDKSAVAADQLPNGDWEIRYQIDVANGNAFGLEYSLSDALAFGEGITVLEAEWALEGESPAIGGAWNGLPGDASADLATDRTISAGATDAYVVTVTASVAAGVIGSEAGQCGGEGGTSGGGFLNTATLTSQGIETTAADCVSPALPDFGKEFVSATQNRNQTWTVTYRLTVDNSANASRAYYSLTDTPAFPSGVRITGRAVQDVSGAGGPVAVPWNGTAPIRSGAEIASGQVHAYEASFTTTVGIGVLRANLVCDPGGAAGKGFSNSASMTSGPDTVASHACGDITENRVSEQISDSGNRVLARLTSWLGKFLR